jgi:hypothetical protein
MLKKIAGGCLATLLAAGCSSMPGSSSSSSPAAATPAPAPAAKSGARDGMDAYGNVVDASKISCGDGPKSKGLNDTEGEVLGRPAPGSKFPLLKIGMGMKQSTDLAGQPTDQGVYITGKAFIPFYFGGDRHRYEMAYKGWGRLIFAGESFSSGGTLICIINWPQDSGYR